MTFQDASFASEVSTASSSEMPVSRRRRLSAGSDHNAPLDDGREWLGGDDSYREEENEEDGEDLMGDNMEL